jgi:hypothetical protein
MRKTRNELIARQHHLARREESLTNVAVLGIIVTAAMFASVLLVSRHLAVAAVAASPLLVVFVAWGWAVQTRVRFTMTGRRVAALRNADERGRDAGVTSDAPLSTAGVYHERREPRAARRPARQIPVN